MAIADTAPSAASRIVSILDGGQVGSDLVVSGWVRSKRGSKNVAFIALNDGSTIKTLQVVAGKEMPDFESVSAAITTGASIEVHGTLVESRGKGQKVELKASAITVLGRADAEGYPLQKKGHGFEFLRSIAHLRSRTNTFGAVFRIRSTLAAATHAFFQGRGFHYVHTPIITASDCEGAGEMFEVVAGAKGEPFFGRQAALTVSGQLNAEALAYGLGLVYTFGPTFRAENSHTPRHLSEFWMIEPEMMFCDIHGDMDLAEAYVKALIDAVFERNEEDLQFLARFVDDQLLETLATTRDASFERITYTEAIELLAASGKTFEFAPTWGADLQTEHERYLTEEHFGKPVIVRDYPASIKAFYMYQNDDDGRTVAAMDVLVPRIGELIGGSQREHRLDRVEARLLADGMELSDYDWYLDLNRYGAAPHAGFGLGFERIVMFCTGMKNIRDVIPFPRAPGAAAF